MPVTQVGYRRRTVLPALGDVVPHGPIVLDTNVILNALTGRGPTVLKMLLDDLAQSYVSAVTIAELRWAHGRLDPRHPQTAMTLKTLDRALGQIDQAKILTPTTDHWHKAGEFAGIAVRSVAGPMRSFSHAAERHDMLNDALTALVACEAGATIITADADFDLFMQLEPKLSVLFYG